MNVRFKFILLLVNFTNILSIIKEIEVNVDEGLNLIEYNNYSYYLTITNNYSSFNNKSNSKNTSDKPASISIFHKLITFTKPSALANTVASHSTIDNLSEVLFWTYVSIILVLLAMSGILSGLTIGYLSIDDLILELKCKNGSDDEKIYANNVLPIIKRRHQLLVTLLIWNAACLESLPIFFSKYVDLQQRFANG